MACRRLRTRTYGRPQAQSTSALPRGGAGTLLALTAIRDHARIGRGGLVSSPTVANAYVVGAINRVGVEAPLNLATRSRDKTELITAEIDLDRIREVRHVWQFLRDRRAARYEALVRL